MLMVHYSRRRFMHHVQSPSARVYSRVCRSSSNPPPQLFALASSTWSHQFSPRLKTETVRSTHAAAKSSCPPAAAGFCTAAGLVAVGTVGLAADGTGGLAAPPVPGIGGGGGIAAPRAGLAPTAGLPGTAGLGLGAGGAALCPMTELGRDELGVEPLDPVAPALTGFTADAAARAAAKADEGGAAAVPFAAGAGGGRRAAGGGGGGADSTNFKLHR